MSSFHITVDLRFKKESRVKINYQKLLNGNYQGKGSTWLLGSFCDRPLNVIIDITGFVKTIGPKHLGASFTIHKGKKKE